MPDNKPIRRISIMRMQRVIMSAITSICTLGSATAGELTGAEIKDLISGKSVYLELTAGSTAAPGQGVIYDALDGNALYKTAMGVMWHGTWAIKDNTPIGRKDPITRSPNTTSRAIQSASST
jgi:hypothetical protein